MNCTRVLISMVLALTGCLSTMVGAASQALGQDAQNPQQQLRLLQLNQLFGESYANAKKELKEKLAPVILVTDKITLLKGTTETDFPWVPDRYTQLKTIDHGPLAAFVLLLNHRDEKLSAELLQKLKTLRQDVTNAIGELETLATRTKIDPKLMEQQRLIVEKTTSFIDAVASQGKVSRSQLKAFSSDIGPATMGNVTDAAAEDLKAFDKAIVNLKKTLSKDEWNAMHVVLVGGHMPRQENTKLQYWLKLLGEKQEGGRIIYFEGPQEDRERALDLLVTHILDTQIAEHFFNDTWRMHRDLLCDGAALYLKKNKIEAATSPFKQ